MADLHRRIARLERSLAHPYEARELPQVIRVLGGLAAAVEGPGHAYARRACLERDPSESTDAFEDRALKWARKLNAEFLILGGLPPDRRC